MESEEARWPLSSRRPIKFVVLPSPLEEAGLVTLEGAASGTLDVRIYDLQGRQVARHRPSANGSGRDSFWLDLRVAGRRVAPAMYFMRATDAEGNVSEATKLVMLK